MKGSNICAAHSVGRHLLSCGKTTDRSNDNYDDDDDVTSSLSADVWPILIYHTMTVSPPEMHLLTACPPPIISSPILHTILLSWITSTYEMEWTGSYDMLVPVYKTPMASHHRRLYILLTIYYAQSISSALLDSPFSVLVLCGVSLAQLCLSHEANTP